MSKPIALLLLALAWFACGYMGTQHERWASFWWWFWYVPGTVATVWMVSIVCDLWRAACLERKDEFEEIEEIESEFTD